MSQISSDISPQLHMIRPDLDGLPDVALPEGYRLQCYREGDEIRWEKVIRESFEYEPGKLALDAALRQDAAFQPDRVLFLWQGDEAVATTSAWYNPEMMADAGTVHWVGVVPSHAGRRLGYQIVLCALHKMVSEGRRRAWLSTDDHRLAAIQTYFNLGFEPLLIHENQRERWAKVLSELRIEERDSFLFERFQGILGGVIWERSKQ